MANKIKNKRLHLYEADVVDTATVELVDILNASSKAEKAILDLCDKCLAFKNTSIKNMALQLKSRAAALTQALSNLEITGNVSDVGGDELGSNPAAEQDVDSQNLNAEGDKQRLDMPEAAPVFESAKAKYLKRKKLKESMDIELEVDEHGDESAKEEIGKEKEVISDNTFDHPSIKEEGEESTPTMGDKVVIDLTEPFETVIKGLDPNEFQTFKAGVVSHLENAIDAVETKKDPTVADQFTKSIEALSASQSVDDFDLGMEQIYDFADENDILVETLKRK